MKQTELRDWQPCIIDSACGPGPDTSLAGSLAIKTPSGDFVLLTNKPGQCLWADYNVSPVSQQCLDEFVGNWFCPDGEQDEFDDTDLEDEELEDEEDEGEEACEELPKNIEKSRTYILSSGRVVKLEGVVGVVKQDGFHRVTNYNGILCWVPFGPGINTVLFVEPN